jgi:quercetin dioxygenase-like cupin family protein
MLPGQLRRAHGKDGIRTMQISDGSGKNAGPLAPAEPAPLGALVDYSAGAIVSRSLYKGKAGGLTLFAFAAGQELSEHTAPFDAFVQVLDGSVELTIGGRISRAKQGEMILMPANVPHALRAIEPFKMLLTMMAT